MVTDGVGDIKKGFLSRSGEEFSLNSRRYIIIEVDGSYFVVGNGLGGGTFGGGGSSSDF